MTHSRKSAAQRAKSLERLKAFRERKVGALLTPQHTASFDAAYGDRPITPEFAQWDERGYMRWNGPTNSGSSPPTPPRNF